MSWDDYLLNSPHFFYSRKQLENYFKYDYILKHIFIFKIVVCFLCIMKITSCVYHEVYSVGKKMSLSQKIELRVHQKV